VTRAEDAALLEMVRQLRDDIARESEARRLESEAARQSRTTTHKRIDEVIDRLGRIDVTVALAGQVDAQVRNELDNLKQTVASNHAAVSPTVVEWQRILRTSRWLAIAFGISGASIAAAVVAYASWFGDAAVHFIRRVLRIDF